MMNHPNHTAAPTWVLLPASMASLMVALDALVVSTALSEIGRDLGASIEPLSGL